MKNIWILGLLIFTCFSTIGCKKPVGSEEISMLPDSLANGAIILLNEEQFAPIFKESDSFFEFDSATIQKLVEEKEAAIKVLIKEQKLDVQPEKYYVGLFSGFYLPKITTQQLQSLSSNSSLFTIQANLDIESRKPMMQSEPIIQSRKPMMQEDWRYDSARYSSGYVLQVGGGDPSVGPKNTRVWIVDSGIDINHRDIIISQAERNLGFSAITNEDAYFDGNGHGTMIAGIIGAKAFNQTSTAGDPENIGINGVYPGAKMVSVKVLDSDGKGKRKTLYDGLEYIALNSQTRVGDVVNMSLGRVQNGNSCNWGNLDNLILTRLSISKRVFVVMSAGNRTEDSANNFPGCLEGQFLFTVGSALSVLGEPTPNFTYSSFSNYGTPPIDWLATGEYVFTTYLDDKYMLVSGTSMSAAMVSGILYGKGSAPAVISTIQRGGIGPYYNVAKWR